MFMNITNSKKASAITNLSDSIALACMQHEGLKFAVSATNGSVSDLVLRIGFDACQETDTEVRTLSLQEARKAVHKALHSAELATLAANMGLGNNAKVKGQEHMDSAGKFSLVKDENGKTIPLEGIRATAQKAAKYFENRFNALLLGLRYVTPEKIGEEKDGTAILESFNTFSKRANAEKAKVAANATEETQQEKLATKAAQFGQRIADGLRGTQHKIAGQFTASTLTLIAGILESLEATINVAQAEASTDSDERTNAENCVEVLYSIGDVLAVSVEAETSNDELPELPEGSEPVISQAA